MFEVKCLSNVNQTFEVTQKRNARQKCCTDVVPEQDFLHLESVPVDSFKDHLVHIGIFGFDAYFTIQQFMRKESFGYLLVFHSTKHKTKIGLILSRPRLVHIVFTTYILHSKTCNTQLFSLLMLWTDITVQKDYRHPK